MRYAPTIIRPISVRANRIRPFAYALSHTPKITLLHYYNITCNIFLLVVWLGFRTKTQIPYQITTHKKIPLPYIKFRTWGIWSLVLWVNSYWLHLFSFSRKFHKSLAKQFLEIAYIKHSISLFGKSTIQLYRQKKKRTSTLLYILLYTTQWMLLKFYNKVFFSYTLLYYHYFFTNVLTPENLSL